MHPLSLLYQSLHAIKSRINWYIRAWSLVSVLRQYCLTAALISTIPARNSLTVKLYRAEQVAIFLPNIEVPVTVNIESRSNRFDRLTCLCLSVYVCVFLCVYTVPADSWSHWSIHCPSVVLCSLWCQSPTLLMLLSVLTSLSTSSDSQRSPTSTDTGQSVYVVLRSADDIRKCR